MDLVSRDPMTLTIIESGCVTWDDLLRCVRNFKYGRNANRENFDNVWYEQKGTCSSKHAFLKTVAEHNGFDHVDLIAGMYLMTPENTPRVKTVLESAGLEGIPEVHCYLRVGEAYLDVTTTSSRYADFQKDILQERVIATEFVVKEKIAWHQEQLKNWLATSDLPFTFEALWNVRELCIQALES